MRINFNWVRMLIWLVPGLIILVISGSHVMDGMMYYSDEEIIDFFNESMIKAEVDHLEFGTQKIRVIKTGKGNKRCIIFSHGAPGSWDAFKNYMVDERLLAKMNIISYDRPGYGGSNKKGAVVSIEEQSKIIQAIREAYGYEEYLLVSHSYGCPISTWNAIEHPEGLIGNVLIAPAIDPYSEKYFWFSGLTYWKWSRWVWPVSFQVAGDEKYTHPDELKKLEIKMGELITPTLYIHSLDDAIAPAQGNIKFMERKVNESIIESKILDDQGHLVIWTNKELITELILDFIDN